MPSLLPSVRSRGWAVAVFLLSICVFALTTQSRLCLYNGDTITDHYLNKSTKATEARDKSEIPSQPPVPVLALDFTPDPEPPMAVPTPPVPIHAPALHPPVYFRPPPELS